MGDIKYGSADMYFLENSSEVDIKEFVEEVEQSGRKCFYVVVCPGDVGYPLSGDRFLCCIINPKVLHMVIEERAIRYILEG